MKLFNYVVTACRYFSTKTTTRSPKFVPNGFKKKNYYRRKSPEIKWTDQQLQLLDAISKGKSVFISGSAGTGKTILVRHIIKCLKGIYGASRVFATASTGVAACAIRGQTLHSFAGIGLGEADRETLVYRILADKKAFNRWNKADALVIDECSMVDDNLFDTLEYIARKVRHVEKKWGGIQLIVSGDFFQLPPVSSNQNLITKGYAFEAKCWALSFDLQVELTSIFRQSDPQLIKLLQDIRRGQIDPEDLRILQERCSEAEPDPSVVRFYPRKEDVDSVNRKQMHNLCEEIVVYSAVDSGKDPWKRQLKNGIAPDKLELCVGARVMLNKNIGPWRKLVNGATGTVIGFCKARCGDDNTSIGGMCGNKLVPRVKFDSGGVVDIYPETWDVVDGDKVVASRKQIPLILAWALSIHKCQGMTHDRVHTDLSRAFDYGMVYVALSRVKSLEGLHLKNFDASTIRAHPKVLQFYKSLGAELIKPGEDDVANKN
ncbi:hypothetical protein LguiA_003468 [Lonicera macranthoides]